MTAPDDEPPPTRLDPGRGAPQEPPGGLADVPTKLDPGRSRHDDEPATVVDPGRTPIASGWARALPARLAERFEILRDLTGAGQQGDVYLIHLRDTGEQRVLKVHRPGWRLDQGVLDYFGRRLSRHVVAVYETGEEQGRQYEVMEYLAGGNLLEWRARHSSGVDEQVLTGLVRQLGAGLADLHGAGIVHRDVKPANLLIRTLTPLEVVIADLGISRNLVGGENFTSTKAVGTVPYTPPEFIGGGRILPAFDWWSLGVTVMELATGRALFEGINNEQVIQGHITTRRINVAGIADDRIRLLCAGLLTMDPQDRWGAGEVDAWLRGESPPVAAVPEPRQSPTAAKEPYVYLDAEYRERDLLAAAMTVNWNVSRALLFGGDAKPRRRLREWLEQFPGPGPAVARPSRRESEDVKLLYQLRAIDPAHPPWYRGWNITPSRLPQLADEGVKGIGVAADIVVDLWRADLLPLLATGSANSGMGGGDGLPGIRSSWQTEEGRLRTLAEAVEDTGARTEMLRILRDERSYALSLSLLAATATGAHRLELRRTLDEQDQALNLPWFSGLVAHSERHWVAFALIPYATTEAADERARIAREAWLRRTERQRESSRRQNRPQALGYAVTGVAAVAVFLVGLVGLSDVAEVATDAQIIDAWFGVMVAIAVTAVAESLLAWDSGGRFHPAYSLLGAGAIVLGRLARNLIARRIAVPVVLVALASLGVLTIFRPVLTPFVLATVIVTWTVSRHLAWRQQDRRERAILAAA